ncbi:MAG: phage tail protein [Sphingomonas sp.]
MKVVKAVVGVAIAVGIAIAAPYLAIPLAAAIGVSATVATAVVGAVLAGAAGLALKALGIMTPKPSTKAQTAPTVIRQSLTDSFILYGRRRVIYLKWVFFHAKKAGGKHYRYFVFAIAGHRVGGNPEWWLNDETVSVDVDGLVTSGKYAGAVWLWLDPGHDDAEANATFVAECEGKWTEDHRGRGIAKIYMKAEMTDAAVAAGFCTPAPVIDGKDDIHDPRDDSIGYTNNGPLVFYDYMALPREEGGFGAYDDEIPDAEWISAQANVADEEVEGEARYALDGVIVTGGAPSEVRDQMIANMAGGYTFSEGKHLMRPGYWTPPSETLSEGDLAGAIQVSAFLPGDVAANEVQGTFIDPDSQWQPMPFATRRLDPAPADVKQIDLDLPWIISRYRAERIAEIALRRAQCEKSVIWPMNIAGLKVRTLDSVQLATARHGLSNYAWQVTNWQLGSDFSVVLTLREENEEIYEDPAPVSPASVAALQQGEAVTTVAATAALISISSVTDADPPDGLLQATDTTITVESHSRRYDDKVRSVDGDTLATVAAEGLWNHVYYDDPDREGGAVTFVATADPQEAANTPSNPYRHYVGSVPTDVMGGSGQSGGGAAPPGWNPGTWNNPEP